MLTITVATIDRRLGATSQRCLNSEQAQVTLLDPLTKLNIDHFSETPGDMLLVDTAIIHGDIIKFTRSVKSRWPQLFLLLMSEESSVANCATLMFAGADYFFPLPVSPERLRQLPKLYEEKREKYAQDNPYAVSDPVEAEKTPAARGDFCSFIGTSPAMQSVYELIKKAAPSMANMFITGESGTGKELAAQAIHELSKCDGNFIAINCSAIPKDLLESELFGRVRGAFTGAEEALGAVELAQNGTLFLDELGEMDPLLQTKLLRFIQTGHYNPVGDARPRQSNVRFVAATNRDPIQAIVEKKLREDLYFRLNIIALHLPALRERKGDFERLATYFLERMNQKFSRDFSGFETEAMTLLNHYAWPGNIRQLENIVQTMVILNDDGMITEKMIPPLPDYPNKQQISNDQNVSKTPFNQPVQPLWKIERDAIEHAVSLCQGQISKAAQLLEVHPTTLYRKREQWTKVSQFEFESQKNNALPNDPVRPN